MNRFFQAKIFLWYLLRAKTKYYLHSPFVYQFYLNVLEGEEDEQLSSILLLRRKLKDNHTLLRFEDFGTGTSLQRSISDIEEAVCRI